MDVLTPTREAAPPQLRALVTVARAAEDGLGKPQRAVIDAAQRLMLETDLRLDEQETIAPVELANHVRDPADAHQLIRLMLLTSLAGGPPTRVQTDLISRFADALDVEEPAVKVMRHLARGEMRRFRIGFYRRSHLRTYARNTYLLSGGPRQFVRAMLLARGGGTENAALVARFEALESLPEDTLGFRFFEHYTGAGFKFPGTKRGFPIGAVFHDFSHVLSGYDTTAAGEMKNAAFQAGFTRHENAFFTALFAILIHTAGVNVAPIPMDSIPGRIGDGELALHVLHGLQRGSRTRVDLGDGWDFWSAVALPLDEARARLGIPPIDEALFANSGDGESP